MPTLLIFVIYLGVVLLLTALLYYPLFQVVDAIWDVRPERVFYRLSMIIAALGFWPLLMLLGINNRTALGFSLDRGRLLKTFSRGLGTGVMIMSVHAILLVLLGARVLEPGYIQFSALSTVLVTGLLSGILVAVIEEIFFRGAMQYHMRRSSSMLATAIMTNLLFASVHFIRPPVAAEGAVIGWYSGWEMLAGIFHRYDNFAGFADSFIALFAAGLLLSLVRERTGHLTLCIGIHAGWVWVIKLASEVTKADTHSPTAFLIGGYDNITGWAATGVLGLVTVWYWRYGRVVYHSNG